MTEPDYTSIIELLDSTNDEAADAITAIQRHGLRSLLTGTPITITETAERSKLPPEEIRQGIQRLVSAGRIEIHDDTITGVGGLTLNQTAHTLRLPDADMYTWCALDAIGIPIAFELPANIATSCPHCHRELNIHIDGQQATGPDHTVLFCPTGPCNNVRADFCTTTNLFCNPNHLAAWKHQHSDPDGTTLDLDATVDLGRQMWKPHTRPT